jgi:precorrin-6A synthase
MKQLLLIGIGAGDPRQVTYEAVEAMGRATCSSCSTRARKDELVRLRKAI